MVKMYWRLIPALLILSTLNACVKSYTCTKPSVCGKCQKTTSSGTTSDPIVCDDKSTYTAIKYACEHRDTTNTTIIEQGWITTPGSSLFTEACGDKEAVALSYDGYTCVDKNP